jgi:hypothetical protein
MRKVVIFLIIAFYALQISTPVYVNAFDTHQYDEYNQTVYVNVHNIGNVKISDVKVTCSLTQTDNPYSSFRTQSATIYNTIYSGGYDHTTFTVKYNQQYTYIYSFIASVKIDTNGDGTVEEFTSGVANARVTGSGGTPTVDLYIDPQTRMGQLKVSIRNNVNPSNFRGMDIENVTVDILSAIDGKSVVYTKKHQIPADNASHTISIPIPFGSYNAIAYTRGYIDDRYEYITYGEYSEFVGGEKARGVIEVNAPDPIYKTIVIGVAPMLPTLSDGKVTPSNGTSGTVFTYAVTYTDRNGDVPTEAYVFIDVAINKTGELISTRTDGRYLTLNMNQSEGKIETGMIYNASVTGQVLGYGNHTYFFYFKNDVDGAVFLPIISSTGTGGTTLTTHYPLFSGPEIIEYTFTYTLHKGMNLISLALDVPGIKTADDLMNDITTTTGTICDSVAKFESGQFVSHGKEDPFNFDIEIGVGYFVNIATDVTYTIKGSPITEVAMNLNTGWNLIGLFNTESIDADNFMSKIATGNISCSSISKFESGVYKTHGAEDPFTFDMKRGNGYFVYLSGPYKWISRG